MNCIASERQDDIYSVSRLNAAARQLLETQFPYVWVEGEISNFAAPTSGHWYFSLKDDAAQVRCAMFRGNQRKLDFQPKNGLHILIKARVSLYENRGEFQLIAEEMEERGEGKLRRQLEELKKKLQLAGLFDLAHKKSLPLYPKQIGIITSPTGAAIRDILHVLKRRYPCASIIIYPSLVQGATAAPTIAAALNTANERKECDVLIIARGGGSLEDLWPFNEEIVAHAIFKSEIPIISGIGHEVDFTIADFVADVRAPTPSAAAEIATPDSAELLQFLQKHQIHFIRRVQQQISRIIQTIQAAQNQLRMHHPKRRLLEKTQFLDRAEQALFQLQQNFFHQLYAKLAEANRRFYLHEPRHLITQYAQRIQFMQHELTNNITNILNIRKIVLAESASRLDTLSPLATLQRGYAIASTINGSIVTHAEKVKPGDTLNIRIANGTIQTIVKEINL